MHSKAQQPRLCPLSAENVSAFHECLAATLGSPANEPWSNRQKELVQELLRHELAEKGRTAFCQHDAEDVGNAVMRLGSPS